jgi:hypothetical protein
MNPPIPITEASLLMMYGDDSIAPPSTASTICAPAAFFVTYDRIPR